MIKNSTRFIEAYNTIEIEMEKRMKMDRHIGFSERVRRLAGYDPFFKRYRRVLEEFADLRNAIIHERIDGEVIAEPHEKVVLQFEHIAQLLTQPTLIKEKYMRKVDICFSDEKVLDVAKLMISKSFSQIPVYDRTHVFVGMLTTDTMMRYQILSNKSLEGVSASDVLPSGKDVQRVAFLSPEHSLIDVVELFEQALGKGNKLYVVLITKNANRDHLPLGIITVHELAEIYDQIRE
ncbi:MAG: CBS domain-containing protein [Erysipelotrichaceae bacterium]|nr:CBS domain-containing protein [Erysipelotrichaceae bacterium]MDP3304516.1 CBS domain-containing protein [Erysipelotrichaceae bacterium]